MTPNEFRKNSKRKEHEWEGVKREGGGQGNWERWPEEVSEST